MDEDAPRPEVEADPLRPLELRLSLRSPKLSEASLWVKDVVAVNVDNVLALAEWLLLLQLLEASTSPESLLKLTGLDVLWLLAEAATAAAAVEDVARDTELLIETSDEGLVLADGTDVVIMVRDCLSMSSVKSHRQRSVS